ncbi:hypothetical protein CCUS01_02269 [Colletotrichum cuscutae]|uniref:Uncharacterized protein n=1 Tax=Colletotrichum cuscutae TaxID=1209917 RepID=A0AAI9XIJ9_9PEZI|nr:hypothetical protein CCUS01_02269 [Colletotrichum cuscutae]
MLDCRRVHPRRPGPRARRCTRSPRPRSSLRNQLRPGALGVRLSIHHPRPQLRSSHARRRRRSALRAHDTVAAQRRRRIHHGIQVSL